MLHEIGRRLARRRRRIEQPDDVFWLTLDELQRGRAALDAAAAGRLSRGRRRATRDLGAHNGAHTPPVALPLEGGARFLGIDFSGVMPARADQAEGDVLRGIAASPGR